MNRKILGFILLVTLTANAQNGIVYFKDGTKKIGFVKYGPKLTASNIKITDKVKFKKNKKSDDLTKFEYSKISKIEFTKEGKVVRTSYFKVPKKNSNVILEVDLIYQGEINIYRHLASVDNPISYSGGYSTEYYFEKGDEKIEYVSPSKFMGASSTKLLKRYFKDCPKLQELIDREAFRLYIVNNPSLAKNITKNRLIEIVKYYSSKCLEKN